MFDICNSINIFKEVANLLMAIVLVICVFFQPDIIQPCLCINNGPIRNCVTFNFASV